MTFEQEVVENKRLRQDIDAKIQEVKDLPERCETIPDRGRVRKSPRPVSK